MKIELTVELTLPDEYAEFSDQELRQAIYDDYVNSVTISHLSGSLEWAVRHYQRPSDELAKEIHTHHKNWVNICKTAAWSYKKVS